MSEIAYMVSQPLGSPAVLLGIKQTHAILGSLTQTPEIVLAQQAVDIVNQAVNAKLELWEGLLASSNSKPPGEFDAATPVDVIRTFIRQEIERRIRAEATAQQGRQSHIAGLYGIGGAVIGVALTLLAQYLIKS